MTGYQITLSYACFGIEAENGRVVRSAPIGGWMVGKLLDEIKIWVASKHGTLKELPT